MRLGRSEIPTHILVASQLLWLFKIAWFYFNQSKRFLHNGKCYFPKPYVLFGQCDVTYACLTGMESRKVAESPPAFIEVQKSYFYGKYQDPKFIQIKLGNVKKKKTKEREKKTLCSCK